MIDFEGLKNANMGQDKVKDTADIHELSSFRAAMLIYINVVVLLMGDLHLFVFSHATKSLLVYISKVYIYYKQLYLILLF